MDIIEPFFAQNEKQKLICVDNNVIDKKRLRA